MNDRFNLEMYRNTKWIIGVSGGPDSMALLDRAFQAGIECVVLHVNYHRRDSAQRDQELVSKFCVEHQIPCFIFDAPIQLKGNFQNQARLFRYEKMAELCLSQKAEGMMVAHHQDDDLETYVMQKNRNSEVSWFGLQTYSTWKSIPLIRPLLDVTKDKLIQECKIKGLHYGWDESNDSLDYERNRIRKMCSQLSKEKKDALLHEKNVRNEVKQALLKFYHQELMATSLTLDDYVRTMEAWPSFLLEWLRFHSVERALSKSYLWELHRQCIESDKFAIKIGKLQLVKHYGQISISKEIEPYRYELQSPMEFSTPHFKVSLNEGEGFSVDHQDFPLTIYSATGFEKIVGKTRSKTLNRWFIEHKINYLERKRWPVVQNVKGEVIFIPKCGISTGLQPNKIHLYMIK